jgi:hypothetical protein
MEREQKAFDSVRKSLEKEERKARKAAMMRRKRHIVLAMVLINVGLLAFLKYYHFFSANVNALGNSLNLGIQLPALKLVMPLGISFYTMSAGVCAVRLGGEIESSYALSINKSYPDFYIDYNNIGGVYGT